MSAICFGGFEVIREYLRQIYMEYYIGQNNYASIITLPWKMIPMEICTWLFQFQIQLLMWGYVRVCVRVCVYACVCVRAI